MQFHNFYVILLGGMSKDGLLHTIFKGNIQLLLMYWNLAKQEVNNWNSSKESSEEGNNQQNCSCKLYWYNYLQFTSSQWPQTPLYSYTLHMTYVMLWKL